MSGAVIIDNSPPGAWRAALEREAGRPASCARCRQSTCHHPDAEYRGPGTHEQEDPK